MKSHPTMQTRFGMQECALCLLTSVVLACILVGAALNFAPILESPWSLFEHEPREHGTQVVLSTDKAAPVCVTSAEPQEALPPRTISASTSLSPPAHEVWNPYHAVMIMAGVTFVTGILAAGMFVVSLYFLLPRLGVRFEPSIRIEYTGVAPAVAPVAAAATPSPAPVTANRFDMGPTLDDLRQAKDEKAERMGEAVLEHLFENNLNMQAQLKSVN